MNNKIPEYEIKYSKIKNIYIQIKNGKIIVKAPKRVGKKEIEKIVEQKTEWIQKTGLKPNKINIKQIKYAWGSCSSKKNITLNLELIKYSQQAIRYVILHELCHLKYMNHSKDFWNLVEKYMPNYKQVKKEFK